MSSGASGLDMAGVEVVSVDADVDTAGESRACELQAGNELQLSAEVARHAAATGAAVSTKDEAAFGAKDGASEAKDEDHAENIGWCTRKHPRRTCPRLHKFCKVAMCLVPAIVVPLIPVFAGSPLTSQSQQ